MAWRVRLTRNSKQKYFIGIFRCGSRGGYYELINLDKDVRMQVNKLISSCLCSTAWGQAVMAAIINPPKEGEPSYELYKKERAAVFNRLKEKADLVSQLFNSVEGVRCNTVMGLVNTLIFVFSLLINLFLL